MFRISSLYYFATRQPTSYTMPMTDGSISRSSVVNQHNHVRNLLSWDKQHSSWVMCNSVFRREAPVNELLH